MENNYSYSSYPDSGDSSPRSREVDFENPPPWEESSQQQQNYKVKFMCSYGGKILPRPHDNQLCYTGGETKILAVDRSINLPALLSRLSSLSDSSDVSCKYQLPGEDLDALISVTNDDDLDHMMHEYDRLYRASVRPARMRLFLFPLINHCDSFGSDRSDRDRFVEALNSGPAPLPDPTPKPPVQNNVHFIPGWPKAGVAAAVTSAVPPPPPASDQLPPPPEFQARSGLGDRVVGSDLVVSPVEFQRQLQDLQRLQIGEQTDHQYHRRKSDDNLVGGGGGGYGVAGDYFNMQKVPEKLPAVTVPPQVSAPVGYWPENKHVSSVGFPGTVAGALPDHHQQQSMYMINAGAGGGGVYHVPPMVRSVTGPTSQGYYHMQQQQQQQRMPSDVYRDQPVYGAIPQPQQQTSSLPPQAPKYVATYPETTPYTQVAYDSVTGRQVYYTPQGGGVVQPPQQAYSAVGPAAVSGEMRVAGGLSQEGKVVGSKIPQTSV
ncbi:uncharacterized protein LOC126783188 [Argentina anserina]|uniref:uncharacterized protein LOC126783188 n=1 Tax=Argentina anserina TaxID=57926 RepID=UPI0021764EFF|nr:uncharacterized protein LOC126783188 [Potentilla anserina]